MANKLRTFLRQTRLALEELRALSWRAVQGAPPLRHPDAVDTCQLEQRVLLSVSPVAAPATVDADADAAAAGVDSQDLKNLLLATPPNSAALARDDVAAEESVQVQSSASEDAGESRLEIVFVDASAADPDAVIANLRRAPQVDFRIFVLDAAHDGIEQISAILADHTDVAAIHLVSHGAPGEIKLGASWLTGDNAAFYRELFAGWQSSLAPDADILVYGCDLADSANGLQLLQSLHDWTGADVAGSDDPTGSSAAGGDWDLEQQFGTVLSQVAFQTRQQSEWLGVLAATTFQQGVNGYSSAEDVAVAVTSRTTADPTATTVSVQGTGSESQVLLRFDDLFGSGTGQIPWGSTINAVALNVEATNYSNAWLELHRMAADWSDLSTWDALAAGVQLNDVEAASVADSSVSFVAAGTYTFTGADLANTVQGWSDGKTNNGWVLVNVAGPAVQLASSDASTSTQRPRLTIDYTAPAIPREIAVTTTQDAVDAPTLTNFATLLASPGADGMISLREAIIAANNQSGMNFITLPTGTIQLALGSGDNNATSGDLDLTDAVSILGADRYGTVIDGNGLDSVFEIRNGALVVLGEMTITGGSSTAGGAIHIQFGSTVTVENARLVSNQATTGGAISNERGTLELVNSELIGNAATSTGGGLDNRDVAILRSVTISGNTAQNGAGINQQGGGTSMTLENVTISGNVASVRGGGVKTATAMTIGSSTIAFNDAPNGGGISAVGAGNSVQLLNTILSNNTGSNSDTALISLGFNLVSDTSAGLNQPTDLVGLIPGLLALQLNGGDIQTHALMDGSIAINAGTSVGGTSVDARGVPRDVMPDIGAVEGSSALSHKIFWVDDSANTLSRANVDGSAKQTLVSGLGNPRGIAVDLTHGYIYWTEAGTGSVKRAGLDGQNVATLISSGLTIPQGIALDVAGNRLYIADDNLVPVLDRIAVAHLDGTNLTTTIDGTASGGIPSDIAFDSTTGYLYWVDQGDLLNTSAIYRALPGSGLASRTALVTAGSSSIHFKSLTLDVPNNRMFWTEDGGLGENELRTAHLDGTGATTISTSAADPYGVAVEPSGTFVVWVDPGLGSMTVTRPDGSSEQTILISLDNPTDIAVTQFVDNLAPSLQLTNQVTTLAETTGTGTGVRIADLTVFDDGVGTNVVSLSGADAAMFEVVGSELRLRAGTVLDYETQTELNVTVSVDDLNVGSSPDDSVALTVSITNVNDETPVGVADTFLVTEDLPLEVDIASGVLANDTDADGDTLSAVVVSGPSHGSLSFSGGGRFVYQPAPNYFGTDSFTYQAWDGVHFSAVTTVTLSVADVSLTPTAEFRVNTTTAFVQETSRQDRGSTQAVAMNPLGDYVVVWSSADQDGSGWGIFGQRFNRFGVAQGTEFQINTTTSDNQVWASVAMDQAGRFVVTWTSANQDGTPTSVFFRVFDANGTARTGELQANVDTGNIQEDSAVDMDASGNFVVAWEGTGPGDSNGVFARRFTVNGFSLDASEFRLNTDLSQSHNEVAVSMNDNGDFAASWDDGSGVQVRRFANTGAAIDATEINVESEVTSGQSTVELANDRSFVAAWRMTVSGARDSFIRRYDSSGTPLAGAQQVHTTTANSQTNPSLAMDSAGNFIVAWEGEGTGDTAGVFYRVYNSSGTALTGETRINQTVSGLQEMVSLAMLDTDNFVLVWSGSGTGDSAGVFARQIAASNAAPIVIVGNAAISYVENDPPLAIDSTLMVTDADDTLLAGASVAITAGFAAGEDQLTFTTAAGILGNYDSATGVLTFTGSSTIANYQTLLRSVSYSNSSDTPSTTNRTVQVTVDDGNSTTTDSRVVRVSAVNDAPTVSATTSAPATEDIPTVYTHAELLTLIGAADAESPSSSLTITLSNLTGVTVSLAGGSGGSGTTFTFHTTANFAGDAHFDYRATDPNGTASNLGHGTLQVAAVNDSPTWSLPGTQTVAEENPLVFSAFLGNSLVADDLDLGATTARLTLQVNHGALLVMNFLGVTFESGENGDGIFTLSGSLANLNTALEGLRYLPSVDYFGTDKLTLLFSDEGGTGTGGTKTATGTVSITVTDVNDPPSISVTPVIPDLAEDANTSTPIQVATISIQDDSLGSNTLTLTGPDAARFTVSGNSLYLAGGTALDYEQWTAYDVTIQVEDTLVGSTPDDTVDFRLPIVNVNDNAPVAVADSHATLEDQTLSLGPAGLLANDSDVDGDALTVQLVDGVSHGSLTLNPDGSFDYTPTLDYVGSDSFRYLVTDGVFKSEPVVVALEVSAANDPPQIAGPVSVHVDEDQPVTYSASDATSITITDPDAGSQPLQLSLQVTFGILKLGSSVDVTMVTGSDNSSLMVIAGTASQLTSALEGLRYSPNLDFTGADWLALTVNDQGATGTGGPKMSTTSLAIDVGSVDDPPQIVTNQVTIAEEQTVVLSTDDIRAVDPDPIPVDVAFTVVEATHARFAYGATPDVTITQFRQSEIMAGWIVLIHDGSEIAPTLVLQASDGTYISQLSSTTFTYVPVNDLPVAVDLDYVVDQGSLTMDILRWASDIEADRLQVHVITPPSHGVLTLNLDGTVRYVPDQHYLGKDEFTYRVWDQTGLGNLATVAFTVLPASSGVPTTGGGSTGSGGQTGTGNQGNSGSSTGNDTVHVSPPPAPVTPSTRPESSVPALARDVVEVVATAEAPTTDTPAEDTISVSTTAVNTVGAERRSSHSERTVTATQENADRHANAYDSSSPTELSEFVFVTHSGLLWNELDQLQQDIGAGVKLQNVVVGSVGSVASGFTVGYVLWAIRSGFILSSLLASMPAWTLLDPLAVVSISDNEQDGDEESLEQLVEERSKEVSQKKDETPC